MAYVDIDNLPIKLFKHQNFIHSYIDFILKKNLTKTKYDKMYVDIIFKDQVKSDSTSIEKEMFGLCYWEDTHYRPSEFTIIISANQSFKGIVNTIGHEMCHVVQMASGKMYQLINDSKKSKMKYKYLKKIYEPWKMEYNKLPWEIEAFGCSLLYILDYCQVNDIDPSAYVPDDLLFLYNEKCG